jgi:hypothetical protein
MDIKRKLQIVEQSVKSISTHDDADSVVVLAALDRIVEMVGIEAQAVREKQAADAAKALS